MRIFTLAQMYQRGYCLGDIDHMIQQGFANYSKKSGATVLMVEDIHGVDEYFNDRAERSRYHR